MRDDKNLKSNSKIRISRKKFIAISYSFLQSGGEICFEYHFKFIMIFSLKQTKKKTCNHPLHTKINIFRHEGMMPSLL